MKALLPFLSTVKLLLLAGPASGEIAFRPDLARRTDKAPLEAQQEPTLESDVVTLRNGSSLRGTILSLGKDFIGLQSPHALEPLKVKGDQLKNLRFQDLATGALPTHAERVELTNGDSFPAQVLTLDESTLTADTWFAGLLEIPRSALSAVFYHVRPQKLLHQGIGELSTWEHRGDWQVNVGQGGSFFSTTAGSLAKALPLPESFDFQTKLSFNQVPNLHLYVAADSLSPSTIDNAYRLTFTSRGVRLERWVSNTSFDDKITHLGFVRPATPPQANSSMDVQLRIDRRTRRIHLILDGQVTGSFQDPYPAPEGNAVIYDSRSLLRSAHILRDLSLYQWDGQSLPPHREVPVNLSQQDTLTLLDGDRISGRIRSLSPAPDAPGGSLTLESADLAEALVIPSRFASTLYFQQEKTNDTSGPTFNLALMGGGSLALDQVTLGKTLQATHPLLGDLTLDRRILGSITRRPASQP